MKTDDLVSAVRDTAGAGVTTAEEARVAVEATLRTLGARLAGGETKDLAAQLPPELAACLPAEGPGESFGLTEFYRRVAEEEAATPEQARQHARAVMAAIKNGITGGEFEDVADQLPAEYDDLLQTGPVQH